MAVNHTVITCESGLVSCTGFGHRGLYFLFHYFSSKNDTYFNLQVFLNVHLYF